jgi:hypothetical protein
MPSITSSNATARFKARFWRPRTLVHGARERLAAMTVVCTALNNNRQVSQRLVTGRSLLNLTIEFGLSAAKHLLLSTAQRE